MLRFLLLTLLLASLGLPIALVLLLATGHLLAAMGDAGGALIVNRVALAGGILWAAGLIGLVVVQGLLAAEQLGASDAHASHELNDEIELDAE